MNHKLIILGLIVSAFVFGVSWTLGYSAGRHTCPDVSIGREP